MPLDMMVSYSSDLMHKALQGYSNNNMQDSSEELKATQPYVEDEPRIW